MASFGEQVIGYLKQIAGKKENETQKRNYGDCIIRNNNGDILLLQRSYQDDFMPGKWCLPGGKIEHGETATEGAQRELFEETGLDISVNYIKTVEKKDCTINYFEGLIENNQDTTKQIMLDNDEHYRYEFVPFNELYKYDLILDLGDYLNEMIAGLPPVDIHEDLEPMPYEELVSISADINSVPVTTEDVKKSFDEGEIPDNDFIKYLQINQALNTITKGFDEGMVTSERFIDALEKAKHYEFVKVNRDGKTFYQYREVGTDKVDEDVETGTELETSAMLGLKIKKYSDKSFLITGDTYKNIDLLRKLKEQLGGLGSWNKALGGWIFPAFSKDKMLAMMADKMSIETYDETIKKEAVINLKNAVDPGTTVVVADLGLDVRGVTTNGSGGIEYTVETDVNEHQVTETEIAIPPADENKAEELINNATEENRAKTGKMLFGKEAGEEPVSVEIEKEGQKEIKIEAKEFATRSGEKINALDFTDVKQTDIQLVSVEKILDIAKPYYIPEINEYMFSGGRDDRFIFDYVKVDDNNFLVALNGFKDGTLFNSDPRYKKVDPAYAVMSLDNLVATTEYYKNKRKAEIKKKVEDHNKAIVEKYANLTDEKINKYKAFSYLRLSASQQKKITESEWVVLPKEEKLKWVEGMASPVFSKMSMKRIKPLEDDAMFSSNFDMYKKFVDKDYKTPRDLGTRYFNSLTDPCVIEYYEAREQIKWKRNDLEIQREENDSSYEKGRETSYGDVNAKDFLLDSHGVKVKLQNGKNIGIEHVEQIKEHLFKVYESFGDRSSLSRNFGLKISHAGDKRMYASKALGLYLPSMKAIGVSNDPENGKFGFTLAHEFSHFLDNATGKKQGRNYASDNYGSTAGQIAYLFRKNMNEQTESKYLNRSCETFARAFEQYHAMKHNGEDAVKYTHEGVSYHQRPEHVNKEKFNTIIKPLIEQFLQENDHLLKSAIDELNIVDTEGNLIKGGNVDVSFELIKSAFDSEQIDEETFINYLNKYNTILKADPSHGGKLVKKVIIDKSGKKETKWVSRNEADENEKDKSGTGTENKPVNHSPNVLSAFAKETPAAELKRVINESSDEKLRQAAHKELDRRDKKEKIQKDK